MGRRRLPKCLELSPNTLKVRGLDGELAGLFQRLMPP